MYRFKNKKLLPFILIFLGIILTAGAVLVYRSFDTRSSASEFAKSKLTYEELPESGVKNNFTNNFTFNVYDTNANKGDWLGLNENQVFWKRLEHKQNGNDWTIKLGKGGQIYSIILPNVGEIMAQQRIDSGEWVDEVYQHVINSPFQKEKTGTSSIVDGDIHQAGYYTKSDKDSSIQILDHSVYSPTFNRILADDEDNSFSFITWPQHAHLPRTYQDNGMLMHQTTRDLGDGVIEITLQIDKWQGIETTSILAPWTAFRYSALNTVLISDRNNNYTQVENSFSDTTAKRKIKDKDTGGWIAVTNGVNQNSVGFGLIFGSELQLPEKASGNSVIRWGTYSTGDTKGIILGSNRSVVLREGDSFFYRYYIVLGPLHKIQKYGKDLDKLVQMGNIVNKSNFRAVAICEKDSTLYGRGCEGEKVVFQTDRFFTKNSYPLFIVRDNNNDRYYIVDNPYKISDDPTKGRTEYVAFLGWARTVKPTNSDDPYVSLSSIIPSSHLKLDNILYIRK